MQTDVIGEFTSNSSFSTLPIEVRERTRLAILNLLAVSIGANSYPQSKELIKTCRDMQAGDLPIYGSGTGSGAISSAWANSSLAHLLDFDDTHLESIVHPSAPVIPSTLALGTEKGRSGEEIIFASTMGMELAIRLALSVGLDERYSDWHNTSLYGTSASALASSVMLHSNSSEISNSILQGLTVATGFLSNRGTASKSFQVGRSSAEGIISSMAAKNGVSVSKNILRTFSFSLSGHNENDALTKDLGKKWHVLNNFLKPYPCGVVLHPGIDAAIRLKEEGFSIGDVDQIYVHVNPVVMVLTAILEPKSGLESKFSVTHAIAAALVNGKLFPEHFSERAVHDPGISEVRKKIKVFEEENVNRGQTIIEVKYKNGRKERVDINRGPETPSVMMNEKDVRSKFFHMAEPVLGAEKSKDIWDYFSRLESKKDVSEIREIFN
jgi:2-methylcitrate dehydratase PrpD